MSLTQRFTRGWFTIEAVRLTEDNLNEVFEWADSKPFFGPSPTPFSQMPVTGLTVFTPTGRVKASFGDWVYETPGGSFKVYSDAEFHEFFKTVEGAA